ncbi:hypothetical protein [Demequina litorisediminis]|uniref:hypothetical protein n=1 Tax=Demequina litorisediminis TaxID=1849022 RepID=UPI0024E16E1A|nr:hypothetical protein [Demequina litorisediminis]
MAAESAMSPATSAEADRAPRSAIADMTSAPASLRKQRNRDAHGGEGHDDGPTRA